MFSKQLYFSWWDIHNRVRGTHTEIGSINTAVLPNSLLVGWGCSLWATECFKPAFHQLKKERSCNNSWSDSEKCDFWCAQKAALLGQQISVWLCYHRETQIISVPTFTPPPFLRNNAQIAFICCVHHVYHDPVLSCISPLHITLQLEAQYSMFNISW